MPFCTNCGASVDSQFCSKCGTPQTAASAQAVPTPNPPPPPSVPPPPAPAPVSARRTNPWMIVLAGCLGLVILGVVFLGGTGYFVAKKVREAGVDPALFRTKPMVAVAKVLAMKDPDLEVLSVDEDSGVVTVRKKSSGKTVTLDFEDLKRGRIDIKGDDGERVTVDGGEGAVSVRTTGRWDAPDWFPKYGGAKIERGAHNATNGGVTGNATFSTNDSPAQVTDFYEREFKDKGMRVTRSADSLTASDDEGRSATVTAAADGSGARVSVTYAKRSR